MTQHQRFSSPTFVFQGKRLNGFPSTICTLLAFSLAFAAPAAALGNVSVGNVAYEQRQLAPSTTQVGVVDLGREALVQTQGTITRSRP